MSGFERYPFQHDGVSYEVRVLREGDLYTVRAFREDSPANGYQYTVHTTVELDAALSRSVIDPVRNLIDLARNDVQSGIWEQYLEALKGRA